MAGERADFHDIAIRALQHAANADLPRIWMRRTVEPGVPCEGVAGGG